MRFDSFLALIGLHQQTPATDVWDLGDKVMNAENFEKAGFPINQLMGRFEGFLNGPNGKGDVTYTQCDDDLGTFTLDDSATKNTPDPVTVPCPNLQFHLAGILSDTT